MGPEDPAIGPAPYRVRAFRVLAMRGLPDYKGFRGCRAGGAPCDRFWGSIPRIPLRRVRRRLARGIALEGLSVRGLRLIKK